MRIESVRPEEWTAALARALARVPDAHRAARVLHCLHLLETGVLDPRGVLVAWRGSDIAGVQVCAPLAGSVCLFWLPAADDVCAAPLVQAGLDWSRSIGCKLAQALANPGDLPFTDPLVRQGFRPITQMHQLVCALDQLPAESPTPLRYQRYRPDLHARFATTLERTYVGTLDCPELNGRRTIEEILAGHRAQGKFHPDFWWLTLDGDVPVGVMLLVEMPDETTWELAYLGIVPEYRRRGLGRAMTLHALHALRARSAGQMLLAVDERNAPALRLYETLGFEEVERNQVLLFFFSDQ